MTPQQRKAILDAADAFGTARDHWAEILDALTERGFSISLDSVRDHTNCETCDGSGTEVYTDHGDDCYGNGECVGGSGCPVQRQGPCPGGSPVVWSAEP